MPKSAILLLFVICHGVHGQTQQFEVASVRASDSGESASSIRLAPGGRLVARNASLKSLITAAWQVRDFQVSGGPPWLDSARFDIDAKASAPVTNQRISEMLQSLLVERFQLKLRNETHELPTFAIVVSRQGSKLSAAHTDCFEPVAGTPPPSAGARPCGGFNLSRDSMAGSRVTMAHLAATLSRILGRTVVDKTSLTGSYDIDLHWSPDETQAFLSSPEQPVPPENGGASLFTAITEQLGLRLESQRAPVTVLIIESASRPSTN